MKTVILVLVLLCLAGVAWALTPVDGVLFLNSSANPATATIRMRSFAEAVVQIEAAAGSHVVTVESRECTDGTCAWVTESTLGGTAAVGSPHKFRVTGRFYEIRVSVANAGLNAIKGWYCLYGSSE
jgi:hypothetical protein